MYVASKYSCQNSCISSCFRSVSYIVRICIYCLVFFRSAFFRLIFRLFFCFRFSLLRLNSSSVHLNPFGTFPVTINNQQNNKKLKEQSDGALCTVHLYFKSKQYSAKKNIQLDNNSFLMSFTSYDNGIWSSLVWT